MSWDKSTGSVVSICLLLVAGLPCQPLQAAEEMRPAPVYGVGRQSCDSYLQARDAPGFTEVAYKSWISGYLSAACGAEKSKKMACTSDYAVILATLDGYCENHRQQSLYRALEQVMQHPETAVLPPG